MSEENNKKYLGSVAEVTSIDDVASVFVKNKNQSIRQIPTETLKEGIYKDLPIDSELSESSKNSVQNKVVSKKIKDLEEYKANSITSEVSGMVTTTTDSAKVKPKNIKLYGKNEQRTLSGKNMFEFNKDYVTYNGLDTIEYLDNGVVAQGSSSGVKPGQPVSSSGHVIFSKDSSLNVIYLEAGTTVTVSTDYTVLENITGTDYAPSFSLSSINDNSIYRSGSPVETMPAVNVTTRLSLALTIKETGNYRLNINICSCLVKIENIQIEVGNVATEYEPYVGGIPSPSINYPQEVEPLGKSGSINCNLCSDNLLDLSNIAINFANLVDAQNGTIQTNYDVGERYPVLISYDALLASIFLNNQNMPYTFACDNLPTDFYLTVVIWGTRNDGGTYQQFYGKRNINHMTFTPSGFSYIKNIEFRLNEGKTTVADTTTIISGIRLVLGDKNMPFTPYKEMQTLAFQTPNGLHGIPLGTTIPDAIKNSPIHLSGVYHDGEQYWIGDTKNENGKDVQRIKRIRVDSVDSYNSIENFGSKIVSDNFKFNDLAHPYVRTPILSTHFVFKTSGKYSGVCFILDTVIRLYDDCGSVEAFNEILAQKEVYVYYILAEPIVTYTSVEELEQFNYVQMNRGNNTLVNDGVCHMLLTYALDTQMYIDTKLSKTGHEPNKIFVTDENGNIITKEENTANISVDSSLSSASTNPVQNKVVTNKFNSVTQNINEVSNVADEALVIAKGANKALTYGDYHTMIVTLNSLSNDTFVIGQNLLIITLNVPDLWISGIADESVVYTFTSDEDFVSDLADGTVQVGYYVLSPLETQKVDLSEYINKTECATEEDVEEKENTYKPITPSTIDCAVKSGLIDNKFDLTSEEKDSVREFIGASSQITPTKSGTTILITDSANVKPKNIKLYGKNEQIQYEGNQLLNINNATQLSSYGVTFSKDGDYISVQGTGVGSSHIFYDVPCKVIPAGTKVYFYMPEGDASNITFYFRDENKIIVGNTNVNPSRNYTFDTDIHYLRVVCKEATYSTKLKIMITTKENAEWEPYVGNEPSPSINYPQEVTGIGECEGYQLIPFPYYQKYDTNPHTVAGVSINILNDGRIELKGTATSDVWITLIHANDRVPLPVGDYYVLMNGINGTTAEIRTFTDTNANTGKMNSTGSFTVQEEGTMVRAWLGITTNTTVDTTVEMMISHGADAKPYKPYVGNTPSGNIGGKVLTGNLLPYPFVHTTHTINGITFTDNGDGSITVNGKAEKNADFVLFGEYVAVNNAPANELTLTGCPAGGSLSTYFINISYRKDGSKIGEIRDIGNGCTLKGVDFDGLYIHIRIMAGATVSNLVFKPMLNEGTVTKEFEPYTEQPFTALTPNGLHGIPLGTTIPDAIKNSPIHMSGVYWDNVEGQYYIGDTKNENCKDVQRIARHYITADDTIYLSSVSTDETKNFSINNVKVLTLGAGNGKTALLMSNIATSGFNQKFNVKNTVFGGTSTSDVPYICVGSEVASTVDEFKTVCVENGVYIDYVLVEPIVTETSEQYDVVMNYPNTNIVNDANAYMEVEYVADTKCYIDNKFKELALAIISQ